MGRLELRAAAAVGLRDSANGEALRGTTVFFQIVTGTLAAGRFTGTVVKRTGKILGGSPVLTGTVMRHVAKSMSGLLSNLEGLLFKGKLAAGRNKATAMPPTQPAPAAVTMDARLPNTAVTGIMKENPSITVVAPDSSEKKSPDITAAPERR